MQSLFKLAVNSAPVRGTPWLARALHEFQYHGLLTPGVRLMRNISVVTKVALVSGAFMTPFALTGYSYVKSSSKELDAITNQIHGAQYLHSTQKLNQAIQAQRASLLKFLLNAQPGSVPPVVVSPQQELADLRNLQQQYGGELHTAKAFAMVVQADQTYANTPHNSPDEQLTQLTEYLRTTDLLHAAAQQGAGISLESGGIEFRLLSIGLSRMPSINSDLFDLVVDGTIQNA